MNINQKRKISKVFNHQKLEESISNLELSFQELKKCAKSINVAVECLDQVVLNIEQERNVSKYSKFGIMLLNKIRTLEEQKEDIEKLLLHPIFKLSKKNHGK